MLKHMLDSMAWWGGNDDHEVDTPNFVASVVDDWLGPTRETVDKWVLEAKLSYAHTLQDP